MKTEENTPSPENQETGGASAPENQETAPKVYANKYKTVEELEKGYQNLQNMHGQTTSELGGLKGQVAKLQETIAAGQQNQQSLPEPVNYDSMRQKVIDDFNAGKIDEGTMADRIAGIQTSKLDQQYQGLFAEQENKFSDMLQQELGKRDQQAVYNEYTAQNPDFEVMLNDGTLKSVIEENPFVRDEYEAYQVLRASRAESQIEQAKQEAFKAGQAETLKQFNGSQPAQDVSGGAGQSMTAPAAAPSVTATPGKAELFQSGLEAFKNASG